MNVYYSPGRYFCKITDHGLSQSSKGTPCFFIKFLVLGYSETEILDVQYERTAYRYITDGTISFALADLEAIGFSGSTWEQLDCTRDGCQDLRGQTVWMYCNHEEYDGTVSEKWQVSRSSPRIDDDGLKNLNRMFGKQLRTATRGKSAPAPPPPDTAPPVTSPQATEEAIKQNDGIPF